MDELDRGNCGGFAAKHFKEIKSGFLRQIGKHMTLSDELTDQELKDKVGTFGILGHFWFPKMEVLLRFLDALASLRPIFESD